MPTIQPSGAPSFGVVGAVLAMPRNQSRLRREGRMQQIQLASLQAQNAERQLQMAQARDEAMQNEFDALSRLEVLPNGIKRIHAQVATPLREEIAKRIEAYGNNKEDFLAAEGSYYRHKIRQTIAENPTIRQEMNNKLHYGQILKDLYDGKILRPEDEASFRAYQANTNDAESPVISYGGSIERPKDLDKFFMSNYKNGEKWGIIDKSGGQTPYGVSRQDVITHLKSQGYSAPDAEQVVRSIGYQDGQYSWKMDKLEPGYWRKLANSDRAYNLSAARFNLAKQKFGYQQSRNAAKDAEVQDAGTSFVELGMSTSGRPTNINGHMVNVQSVVSRDHQRAVRGWAGIGYRKNDSNEAELYLPVAGENGKNGRRIYQVQPGNGGVKFYNRPPGDGKELKFKEVDDTRIVKLVRNDGSTVPTVKAVTKEGETVYIQLPSDKATLMQVINDAKLNQSKATRRQVNELPDDDLPLDFPTNE